MKPVSHRSSRGTVGVALALFVFGICPVSIQAGSVSGVVVNKNTGSVLKGATVKISGVDRSVSSGKDGGFEFRDLPAGNYTLTTDYIGSDAVDDVVQVPEIGSVFTKVEVGEEVIEMDVFEVEGMRDSRERSLQQKFASQNIRDVMSADSIGNLPDRAVADALSRLPGVSVDLSKGEARFVSIRGLEPSLNNVTLNGVTMATPGRREGRAMSLDIIGASSVSSLEVIKTSTPDMDSQGIGGTVNIETASGFDNEKTFFNGFAEVGYVDLADDYSYATAITYGTTFKDRTVGLALTANYDYRPYRSEKLDFDWDQMEVDTNGDGEVDNENFLGISGRDIQPEWGERERFGVNGKLEFVPDQDTRFYVQLAWSRFTDDGISEEWQVQGEETDDTPITLTGPQTGYFPAVDNMEIAGSTYTEDETLSNIVIGGMKRNGAWTFSGELAFSKAEYDEPSAIETQWEGGGDEFTWRDGDTIPPGMPASNDEIGEPIPVFFDLNGDEPSIGVPGGIEWDPTRLFFNKNVYDVAYSEDQLFVPKFDIQWDTYNMFGAEKTGFLKFGGKYFSRTRSVDKTSVRPQLDDLFLADVPNSFSLPGHQVRSVSTPYMLNQNAIVYGYFGGPENADDPRWDRDYQDEDSNNVEDDYEMDEKILGLYGMFSMNLSPQFTLFGGVRYEKTDVDVTAFLYEEFEDEVTDTEGFDISPVVATFNYNDFLPNLQFRYNIRDDLVLRGAYTRTIGRPDFEDAAPISAIEFQREIDGTENVAEASVEVRNPALTPYLSDNFDLSIDYYLKSGGILSAAFFHKEIDDPIYEIQREEEDITVEEMIEIATEMAGGAAVLDPIGIPPGTIINEAEFQSLANADSGRITGVELTAEIPFTFLPSPFDGFGFGGNVTFIDSSVTVPGREGDDLPFFRQPDTIGNLSLYYQKGRYQFRLAYRYQNYELDDIGDEPIEDDYKATRFQWDAQFSVRLTERFSIYGNIQDITGELDDVVVLGKTRVGLREEYGFTARLGVRFNL